MSLLDSFHFDVYLSLVASVLADDGWADLVCITPESPLASALYREASKERHRMPDSTRGWGSEADSTVRTQSASTVKGRMF